MSSRNLNDPYRAMERTLLEVFDRIGRLESRAWPGSIRTMSAAEPLTPTVAEATTALQFDVHRGKWAVIATGEFQASAHPIEAAYTLSAALFEVGTTTLLSGAQTDLAPVAIRPSWTATAEPLRLQAVLLGSIAAEQPFTFALQVSSNTVTQPTWHNLKVVLLPS